MAVMNANKDNAKRKNEGGKHIPELDSNPRPLGQRCTTSTLSNVIFEQGIRGKENYAFISTDGREFKKSKQLSDRILRREITKTLY